MNNQDNKIALLAAKWTALFITIAIIAVAFVVVVVTGFQWNLFLHVFRVFWIAFLVIIGFSSLIIFFVTKYPLRTVSISLLIVVFLFLIASLKGNEISMKLNLAINSLVDVNLVMGAFTIAAFILAFYAVYKERQKKQ